MGDDDKTSVKTYVPKYQKEKWADHADELDMSQSEFIRTMVQAGREDFEIPSANGDAVPRDDGTDDESFDDRIVMILEREGPLGWDELVDRLIDDVEGNLDTALERLQDDNRVRYSGRTGGYVLTNDE